MAEVESQDPGSQLIEDGLEPKKRKFRKGTRSCWECKRRKVKCTFAKPTDSVCNVCRRRGASCAIQEFTDEPPPPVSTGEIGDRLGRVETLIGLLVQKSDAKEISAESSDSFFRAKQDTLVGSQCSTGQVTTTPSQINTNAGRAPCLNRSIQGSTHKTRSEIPSPQTGSRPCSSTSVAPPAENARSRGKYDELSRRLLAAWPSQHELDIILSIPSESASIYHGVICIPYSELLSKDILSSQEILQKPQDGVHPVLIARKLLVLGSYMQGIRPCYAKELENMTTDYRNIMSTVVETAISLVNSNDKLVDTLEGIECIMIESMYKNNTGNLRLAYLAMRRAMVIAQMFGLHRGTNTQSLKILEPQTKMCINPAYMWFRLVQSDRYLSLMLGLPQGSPESNFAYPEALKDYSPLEQMERIDCVAGGRIIQRNYAEMHDVTATMGIDNLLQKAAACMPAQWWLAPNLTANAGNDKDILRGTIRMMNQLAHYNILLQLHLPYLLHSSIDNNYRYSKMTTVTASRELLLRFLSLRNFQSDGSYCRGVDFLAFIASTALCLAHIDAHRHRQRHINADINDEMDFNFLAHQRLSDRGMMEQTLESMEHMVQINSDALASKIAGILRHLLIFENDAATGGSYTACPAAVGEERVDCVGEISDTGKVLRINIPYLGTIKIEHHGISSPIQMMPFSGGIDYHSSNMSINPDWDNTAPPQHLPLDSDVIFGSHADDALNSQLLVPGLTLGANDWALQGVDIAFFDSLIRGSDVLGEMEVE